VAAAPFGRCVAQLKSSTSSLTAAPFGRCVGACWCGGCTLRALRRTDDYFLASKSLIGGCTLCAVLRRGLEVAHGCALRVRRRVCGYVCLCLLCLCVCSLVRVFVLIVRACNGVYGTSLLLSLASMERQASQHPDPHWLRSRGPQPRGWGREALAREDTTLDLGWCARLWNARMSSEFV
jgi:hypothetical protein